MKITSSPVPPPPPGGKSDKEIREALLKIWKKLGHEALAAHCGGRGLVVGCPVCGKRWGR